MFGDAGQRKLEAVRIGIVGLGGIGSHVAQLLAYLGVRRIGLIDDDHLDETNLNRVIGAGPSDIGQLKTDVARAHVLRIIPGAEVTSLPVNLRTAAAFDYLKQCSVIFGGVDHDGPRLVLTEFSAAYRIPLIDIATEIFPAKPGQSFDFGGRVVVALPGEYCLFCANQIDRELAKEELETPEIRALRRKHGYGIGTDGPAPSVCALNGIVANLAVTEFMVMATGIRDPARRLTYKGMRGVVTASEDRGTPDCYTCKCICGQGDQAGLARYLLADSPLQPSNQ